jgi:uncharacterized protein YciI
MRFAYVYLIKPEPDRVRAIAPHHAAYWQQLALRDYRGGPFADRSGGLITFDTDSPERAEELVSRDPFLRERLLERHSLKEWIADTGPGSPHTVHVRGPRPTSKQLLHELRDVAVAVPLALAAPLIRPWHARWGASDDEIAASMPGDELVPGCQVNWTRAITIEASPASVWPWLAQVGFGKAGFYSNDLLDNAAHPSADRIDPQLQRVRIGAWVPMFSKVDATTAFRVHSFKPRECLVWSKPDSTWAWTLTPLPQRRTRLVTRLRQRYDWSAPGGALVSVALIELGDFPMMRRMLKGIKERAEAAGASAGAGMLARRPKWACLQQPAGDTLTRSRSPEPPAPAARQQDPVT